MGLSKGACDPENGEELLNLILLEFDVFQCKQAFTFKGQPHLDSLHIHQHIGIHINISKITPLVSFYVL